MKTAESAIDPARIAGWIDTFASFNDDPSHGVTRLAYTPTEREAHRAFADAMTALGLAVRTDAAGNTIAELEGQRPELPVLATGSHLDSVPQGGRFDGIAGVCAAMEIAAVVAARPTRPLRTWRFVVFAGEEGARFGQACNGSRMIAGLTGASDLAVLHDAAGVSLADAMRGVGLDPARVDEARWRAGEVEAFLELHIEQGVVLEQHDAGIGVVDAISGSSRALVTIEGRPSHSGGTPMELREDALAAAAECVLAAEAIALDHAHRGCRITVGRLDVSPNAMTTIPGSVVFTIDVRDLDGSRQRDTMDQLLEGVRQVADRRHVRSSWEAIGDTSPVFLPERLAAVTEAAARDEGATSRRMPSGASHDAQQINTVCPAGMIFVPSRDGISHDALEWTSTEELALGTRVLLRALESLDADR